MADVELNDPPNNMSDASVNMSEAPSGALPACRPIRLRRILSTMSDAVARLNAALEGRYAIERELGEGGMATVYLAADLKWPPTSSTSERSPSRS